MDAADALARRGVRPYEPELKEGIALVNGAPLAPALAAWLADRCRALLDHATLAGALTAALAGSSLRPYSERIGRLKGDPGQEQVHAQLARLHAGAADWSDRPQAPVSFRVLPQVHGAAGDVVDRIEAQVARELRAVTDSPLYLGAEGDEPEGCYPSGNFHSQALSSGLDALAIAFAQVGNLSEKRLHRLLDSRFSGLADQLASDPGPPERARVRPQVGARLRSREPHARRPRQRAFVRQLDRAGGLPGVHLPRGRAARPPPGQPRADPGRRAGRDRVRRITCAPARCRRAWKRPLRQVAARVVPVGENRALSEDVESARDLIRSGALVEGMGASG